MIDLQWFLENEEKRRQGQINSEVTLINQNLQQLLKEVRHQIRKTDAYSDLENSLINSFYVVQSTLWDLRYANNYESIGIAIAQGIFLHSIIEKEKLEGEHYLKERLERLMRQVGNIDTAAYLRYKKEIYTS